MFVSKNLNITFGFIFIALISFIFSDFSITSSNPLLELKKFSYAILDINIFAIPSLLDALFKTIAIAIISIFFSSFFGILLSFVYSNAIIRNVLAFLRSIHEIFWALIFLQIFGLNILTALLAIIIPYSAILAKVYSEILEENDTYDNKLRGKNFISFYFYTKVPDAFIHLLTYTSYRFECALRSSAILGFVGVTSLGYYLSSSFNQGNYADVWLLLLMFYCVIASIKFWFNKYTFVILFFVSFYYLPEFASISLDNLIRFFTSDIIPAPIKNDYSLAGSLAWTSNLVLKEIIPGIFNTILLTQVSLVLSGILALVLFPFVCNKFSTKYTSIFSKSILIILRSTPEYILAYLFLGVFGPSFLPAAMALMLHNGSIIAFLMGKQSDELRLRIDVSRFKLNLYFYEVLPRIYSSFLTFLFYRWEIIMRESAILGMLGIGTLGFFIDSAISDFRLDKMMILLIVTACLNILIENISRACRSYLANKDTFTSCGCSLK